MNTTAGIDRRFNSADMCIGGFSNKWKGWFLDQRQKIFHIDFRKEHEKLENKSYYTLSIPILYLEKEFFKEKTRISRLWPPVTSSDLDLQISSKRT